MAICLLALALVYLPFLLWVVFVAYGVSSSRALAGLVGVAALASCAFLPAISERVALRLANAEPLAPGDDPRLEALVERLCGLADLPVPRLALMPSDFPNAFSAGRSRRDAVIVLTRGLLARLDERELEAVVAHELAHVANRDAFVMTLAGAPALLGRKLLWGTARLPFTVANPVGKLLSALLLLYLLPVLFVGWIVYAFATLLVMSISRYREYAADRGAALITGAPENVMSALQTLADAFPLIPERDLREVARMNAFFVLAVDGGSDTFEVDPLRIFPTHPPLERRLARLAELARTMARPSGHGFLRAPEPIDVPPASKPGNAHAVASFLLALLVWGMLAGAALAHPAFDGDAPVWIPLIGSAALLAGVVLGFRGIGRASAGASGMAYAVTGLVLLLGPWALAAAALVIFSVLALLGVSF
jgi:heat shock protein HtpX